MKSLLILSFLLFTTPMVSIYDFKMVALDGTEINFSQYKGKNLTYRKCCIEMRLHTTVC